MPTRHNETFDETTIMLAGLAKAFAHPARVRILEILARRAGCICGDIVQELPLAQATVSQHLKELKRVGLIRGDISGPRTCYCLDTEKLNQARDAFTGLFTSIECCQEKGEIHELEPKID